MPDTNQISHESLTVPTPGTDPQPLPEPIAPQVQRPETLGLLAAGGLTTTPVQFVKQGQYLQCVASFAWVETANLGTWIVDIELLEAGKDKPTSWRESAAMSNTGLQTIDVPLMDGILLSVQFSTKDAGVVGVPFFGAAYIRNASSSAANRAYYAPLFQTTWSAGNRCGFPYSKVEDVNQQPGILSTLRLAGTLATGGNYVYTMRLNQRFRAISIAFNFVTSAAVAARTVQLFFQTQAGSAKAFSVVGPPHAASLSWDYTYTVTNQAGVMAGDTYNSLTPFERLPDVVMQCEVTAQGDKMTVVVANVQAADAISNLQATGYMGFII